MQGLSMNPYNTKITDYQAFVKSLSEDKGLCKSIKLFSGLKLRYSLDLSTLTDTLMLCYHLTHIIAIYSFANMD